MKKIIYFSLISLFSLFVFSQTSLAAYPCSSGKGSCSTTCTSNETKVDSSDCPPPTVPGLKNCCVPKGSTGNTTNNSGFGFDIVDDVATKAGYDPQNELTIDQRISSIVAIFLSLLGVIFFILMLYGGYNWMTAAGDEKKVEKAKDTIRNALIGLIIVIAAYAISVLVITRLWGAGTTTL